MPKTEELMFATEAQIDEYNDQLPEIATEK